MSSAQPSAAPPQQPKTITERQAEVEAHPTLKPPAADAHAIAKGKAPDSPPAMSNEAKAKLVSADRLPETLPAGAVGPIRAVAGWLENQHIDWLWTINEHCNAWVGVSGTGWVKLSNASESGIVALTILAAHAKQMHTSATIRQEADGMIHEMYVW